MTMADTIRAKLDAAFTPQRLDIVDDSARHAGHAGASEGGADRGETHFSVSIVSVAFSGLGRVERQRRVYDVLADELKGPIHALALKTAAPGESI